MTLAFDTETRLDEPARWDILAMLNRLLSEVHIPIQGGIIHITDLTPSVLLAITESLLSHPLMPLPHPRPRTPAWQTTATTLVLRSLSSILDQDMSHLDPDGIAKGETEEQMYILGSALIRAAEHLGWLRPERYQSTPKRLQPSPPARSVSSFPTTVRSSSRASAPSRMSVTSVSSTSAGTVHLTRTSRASSVSALPISSAPTPIPRSVSYNIPSSASSSRTSTTSSSFQLPPSPTPVRSRSATPSATFEEVRALSRLSMAGRRSVTPLLAGKSSVGSLGSVERRQNGRKGSWGGADTWMKSETIQGEEWREEEEGQEGKDEESELESESGQGYLSVVDDVSEWEQTRLPHTSSLSSSEDPSLQHSSHTTSSTPPHSRSLAQDLSAPILSPSEQRRRKHELLQKRAELLRQLAQLRVEASGMGLMLDYQVVESGHA